MIIIITMVIIIIYEIISICKLLEVMTTNLGFIQMKQIWLVVDPWLTKKQVFPKLNWVLNRKSTEEPYLLEHKLDRSV